MAKSKKGGGSCIGAGIICLALVAGCTSIRPAASADKIRVKSGTELAVEALDDSLLEDCGLMPPAPDNSIGDLLQDGTKAMGLLAECHARHQALVLYLRPVVAKERTGR